MPNQLRFPLLAVQYEERRWIQKHGKKLSISNTALMQLRNYFASLDQNGDQAIDEEEFQDPLMLFGLCESLEQVSKVVRTIDFDGSGKIQFQEFLEVFRRAHSRRNSESQSYHNFIKALEVMDKELENGVSARVGLSLYRRRRLLNVFISNNRNQKQQGLRVMRGFQQQIDANPALRAIKEAGLQQASSLLPFKMHPPKRGS